MDKNPVVVTSFTEDGYERYGKRFIETFREFWPKNVKLMVYFEGSNLREGWHHINEVANLDAWMRVIGPFQLFHGSIFNQYQIDFDARTNRVIFMINHALRTLKRKVFWIDADCVTHSPVPEGFLDECLPDEALSCYLGRGDWYDSETGFIGYNYDHPSCEFFLKIMENTLFSGIIFSQDKFWDMRTVDWSRACLLARHPELAPAFVDLAKDLPRGTMHVFINSVVGKYLDHLKGRRKKLGHSMSDDLVVERTEPYWQNIINEEKKAKAA